LNNQLINIGNLYYNVNLSMMLTQRHNALVAPLFELFWPLARIPNSKGNPFSGGYIYTAVGKISNFWRKSPFI